MGWQVPWYSSDGSDFNYDFHVSLGELKAPLEYNYKEGYWKLPTAELWQI